MSKSEKQAEIDRLQSNGLYWLKIAEIYKHREQTCLIYLSWARDEFDKMDKVDHRQQRCL